MCHLWQTRRHILQPALLMRNGSTICRRIDNVRPGKEGVSIGEGTFAFRPERLGSLFV